MPNQATYANPRLDLGVALAEFDLSKSGFIGLEVLPIMRVDRQAATFSKIEREGLLRRADVKRGPRGAYNRDEFGSTDQVYATVEYGHEQPLDDRERAFFENDFAADFWAVQVAFRRIAQEHEIRTAADVFNTTTWTGASLTTAVGTAWSVVTADTKSDVLAASEKVRTLTGMEPNIMIINKVTLNNLLVNTLILDSIKYVARTSVEIIMQALADFYGLDRILIGKGVFNSADEGQPFVKNDIWSSDKAMIMVACDEGASLQDPCVGRTMQWIADSPDSGGITTEQYREEQTRSWIYRARQFTDELIIDASYGHLLTGL